MELVEKIVIISTGVTSLLLYLLLIVGACELMANIYTETHKDELNNENDYYDDDDDYESPFYKIYEVKDNELQ